MILRLNGMKVRKLFKREELCFINGAITVRPIEVWDLKGPLKWVPTFPTSSTTRLFKNKPLNY